MEGAQHQAWRIATSILTMLLNCHRIFEDTMFIKKYGLLTLEKNCLSTKKFAVAVEKMELLDIFPNV